MQRIRKNKIKRKNPSKIFVKCAQNIISLTTFIMFTLTPKLDIGIRDRGLL